MHSNYVEMKDFLIKKLKRELTHEELTVIEWFSKWGPEVHDPLMKLFHDLTNQSLEQNLRNEKMKKDIKKCCVCDATKNLYSVTPEREEKGKYIVRIYCEKHLPD